MDSPVRRKQPPLPVVTLVRRVRGLGEERTEDTDQPTAARERVVKEFRSASLTQILSPSVQGDHSGCSQPLVDVSSVLV